MEKNVNPFGNLPEDVVYLILKELDVYVQPHTISNPIPPWPPSQPLLGLEEGHRDLRSLSSTCKNLRVWAEPILFRQIVVFNDSDADFEAFRDTFTMRTEEMLQKDNLKYLTKLFEFRCYGFIYGNKHRECFWEVFARLLSHFSSLEMVILDIPVMWHGRVPLGTYPPHLREVLFRQEFTPISKEKETLPAKVHRLKILDQVFSRLAFGDRRRINSQRKVVQTLRDTTKMVFPSVTEVALSVDVGIWLLSHCPNVQSFTSLKYPFHNTTPSFEVVHSYIPSMKGLSLESWAVPSVLEALSQKYPGVEELALYPPIRRDLLFVGVISVHLDEPALLVIPPFLRRFSALRGLTLKHIVGSNLFPGNLGDTLRTAMQKMVREMGNMCPTLQVVRLGPYIYHRKDAWICTEMVASAEFL